MRCVRPTLNMVFCSIDSVAGGSVTADPCTRGFRVDPIQGNNAEYGQTQQSVPGRSRPGFH